MNQLSMEKSPYLRMHANNPVNWFPWGPEAFQRAGSQDKPIFLSIGYSSCHWCHVIARESFEDQEVAKALNDGFISIKVDKEERPDVDAVYMDAVELSTGSGGWPMTLLLMPDGAPFFAATYLSKGALLKLVRRASDLWKADRSSIQASAKELARRMLASGNRVLPPAVPDASLVERAARAYEASFDRRWGGFGRAPKFPAAHNLLFLLAHYERTGDRAALGMAEDTLAAMAQGGIFDAIGGGFCRYSVDRMWLIPHFEKMLYDNALLLWAYAEAWRVTQKPLYREVARRTAEYVLREMTGPEGEFYCAQDADSEGREGAYYVFNRKELIGLLGEADGRRFCDWYGVTEEGNFEGESVPNRVGKAEEPIAEAEMEPLRRRVYRYRRERLPLKRDDKVLTSWNALMICALAAAHQSLEIPEYLEAARRAEKFLRARLVDEQGKLLLRFREGEAKGRGVLADYAFYALALLKLYEAAGEREDLQRAETIANEMLREFADEERGGLYLYSRHGEALITRPKDIWDAAMPSGNSAAALALWMLEEHTGDARWQEEAERQLRFVASAAAEYPTGHGFALLAVTRSLG